MKKLYVLLDKELPVSLGTAQACHAVAEFCISFPFNKWKNEDLIVLKSNRSMEDVIEELRLLSFLDETIQYSIFKEPDLGNKITSIAVYTKSQRMFKSMSMKLGGK